MLSVATPPVFSYYLGAFGNGGQAFSWLLRKTVITKFTPM